MQLQIPQKNQKLFAVYFQLYLELRLQNTFKQLQYPDIFHRLKAIGCFQGTRTTSRLSDGATLLQDVKNFIAEVRSYQKL